MITRRVEIAGITAQPDGFWMIQMARRLTDAIDGFLIGKRFLIHDRDPLFTTDVRATLAATGVNGIRLPPRSPNLNAYAERFVRTIKESCLDRMILFGEAGLRKTIQEFIQHYRLPLRGRAVGDKKARRKTAVPKHKSRPFMRCLGYRAEIPSCHGICVYLSAAIRAANIWELRAPTY